MKAKLELIAGIIIALFFHAPIANAQAPSTVAGGGFLMQITSGTYPLASYGYAILLPANSGNFYQEIGIYGMLNSSGTYSYMATGSSTGQAIFNDTTDAITNRVNLTFSSATEGTFSGATISPPGYYQAGYFVGALGQAPGSIAGQSLYCTVADGRYPFASSGNFTIVFSASGYTLTGGGGVGSSSGTYSYSIVNRSVAAIQISDSVVGISTFYVGFSTSSSGGYATKQSSTGGFQVGSFTVTAAVPGPITLVFPSGSVATSSTQRYTWTADAEASLYELSVVRNGTAFCDTWFSLSSSVVGSATGNFAVDVGGHTAGSYQWYVRGYNFAGLGSWSSMGSFTMVPPTAAGNRDVAGSGQ